MSFNELMLTIEQETLSFEKAFNQCMAFSEASYQEYKTNLKEAELKVIQESGTPEDLVYLEDAAKEGFIVRAGKTVTKMIEYFIKWLQKIINSIQEFLTKKENKETLDKAEKIIKSNPKVKNDKMEIPDIEKMERVCQKHEANVNRKLSMFKAGKISENDIKELDEIEKNYEKEKESIGKVKTTITIVAAISFLTVLLNKLRKQEKDVNSISTPKYKETDDPEKAEVYTNAVSLKLRIKKELVNTYNDVFNTICKTLKGVVTDSKEIEPEIGKSQKNKDEKDETKTESVIEEGSYLDNLFAEIETLTTVTTESQEESPVEESSTEEEFDAEAYLEALEVSLPDEGENEVIESTESSDELEKYLEALEKEICGDFEEPVYQESTTEEGDEMVTVEEYLEAMEAELFEDDSEITESEEMTAEEYLTALESELFDEKDSAVTAEEYLEAMEAELFE